MKWIVTSVSLLLFFVSLGQQKEKYYQLKKEADNLYFAKEYKKSAEKYKEAFGQLDGKAYPTDRYNAACSYALANDLENSFYHLFRLAESPITKYKNYNHITTDTDLNSLHTDERWGKLLAIVKRNKEEAEKHLELPLVKQLEKIYVEDQKYRLQLNEIEKKHGRNSKEIKDHWKVINQKDSLNLIEIEKILDKRGWLGPQIIGEEGNSTLFLVIQHSDLETQEKYLPMMKEAVKKGDAQAYDLALLEDRIALRQGKKQIYGSQIGVNDKGEHYVFPLIDPENVDKRRAEVDLAPISEYVAGWNFEWNVEKHIKRTAEIEANKKKK